MSDQPLSEEPIERTEPLVEQELQLLEKHFRTHPRDWVDNWALCAIAELVELRREKLPDVPTEYRDLVVRIIEQLATISPDVQIGASQWFVRRKLEDLIDWLQPKEPHDA
jgi:hypothetical protein